MSIYMTFSIKNTKQCEKNNYVKYWSRVVLKTGPSMLHNKKGPNFNTTFWSFFLMLAFSLKNFLLQGERDFHPPQKNGPILNTRRANVNSTAHIYTYIHVCIYIYIPAINNTDVDGERLRSNYI